MRDSKSRAARICLGEDTPAVGYADKETRQIEHGYNVGSAVQLRREARNGSSP